eukprot:c4918_g1_i1.p1 GENE.c4918_g1_i1~~c4918_g1_i1.p1  ORF type:complete len:521 (+),score=155.14 c4918_g1_i1:30-1592(+)
MSTTQPDSVHSTVDGIHDLSFASKPSSSDQMFQVLNTSTDLPARSGAERSPQLHPQTAQFDTPECSAPLTSPSVIPISEADHKRIQDTRDQLEQIESQLREIEYRQTERAKAGAADRDRGMELKRKLHLCQQQLTEQELPFRTVPNSKRKGEGGRWFGLDIGGTLAKLVFYEPLSQTRDLAQLSKFVNASEYYGSTGKRVLQLSFSFQDGLFHFILFETHRMASAIDLIVQNRLHSDMSTLSATGGGAYKYSRMFEQKAGIVMTAYGELECAVRGLLFLVRHVKDELYTIPNATLSTDTFQKETYETSIDDMFPFIVVNIGSGVSVLFVENERTFERVNGTALGGGTYLGLCRLFTRCETFEEALRLAERGHASKLDLLVGDIYGGDCENLSLPSSATAASFGKAMTMDIEKDPIQPEDFARALLTMISNNIGQIALLTARQLKAKHVVFAGNFLRHNNISQRTLAFATNFWSKGTLEALFLRHEGFCGALGALLHTIPFDSVPAALKKQRNASVTSRSD